MDTCQHISADEPQLRINCPRYRCLIDDLNRMLADQRQPATDVSTPVDPSGW